MDEFTNKQYQLNQDVIAAYAGFGAIKAYKERHELLFVCPKCGEEVTEKELSRNGGICDHCASSGKLT